MSKTVLVTGASRNIGRHLAERLAADGHRVAVCARTVETIEEVAHGIRDAGGEAVGLAVDVADPDAVAEMVATVERQLGAIDVLINNAVVRVQRPITEMTFEEWRLSLGVILDGAFNCTRAVVPGMRERGWGRILNMTGTSALRGSAGRSGVVSAKSGLIGFTRTIAQEVGRDGITVNGVSPGRIDTSRGEWTILGETAEALERYERSRRDIPVGRMGTMDEVADLVRFLVSDAGAYITGQNLCINGGVFMQ